MEDNMTSITEFTLLGFPLGPRIQMVLFGLFTLFYTFTLLGNGLILGLISLDPRLHTPMYFFLSHLAIVDIAYACNTVPQMLVNLLRPDKPISFAGCLTQTFLFLTFAVTECLLLVVMSYDRYVAICHPLRYSVIMSWRVCITLVLTSWTIGVLLFLVHLMLLLPLPFCRFQKINHFFCKHGVKSSAEIEEGSSGLELVVWEGDKLFGQNRKKLVMNKKIKEEYLQFIAVSKKQCENSVAPAVFRCQQPSYCAT
ncbi:olfactory receptor 13-like [Canis lupus dingo]|uniref:olfactory receptor 13-like n=1 Tax=Canis lupus dingo TaxID=286419 RepID=UPI00005A4CF6|nr:olfactory receptor 13-like [Canis lupus dingo]|eukprot:XP_013963765.1 olfactory receptor 13-like [Canis lupus familiaris]